MDEGEQAGLLETFGGFSESQWRSATEGTRVFDCLLALRGAGAVEKARRALEGAGEPGPRGDGLVLHWRRIAEAMVSCAEISEIDWARGDSFAALARLLDRLGPGFTAPTVAPAAAALDGGDDGDTWASRQVVRSALCGLAWDDPLCAGWAWDLICGFWGAPRRAAHTVAAPVLLIQKSEAGPAGVPARVVLEWLPGGCGGCFYPDPATSSFLRRAGDWRGVEQAAIGYVRGELRLWQAANGGDVRWALIRQDGKPLRLVDGDSAGGAYALALASLAAKAAAAAVQQAD